LLRENNLAAGLTRVWTYDNAGNILSKKEYAYTTGALGAVLDTVVYSYGDSSWGDLLTAYDGKPITYDGIGNPLTYDGWTFTWEHGRELSAMSKAGTTWQFTYDANGMRSRRSRGSTVYQYVYNGSQLSQMKVNGNLLNFFYGANGPLAVQWNGTSYYYIQNLQGDIIAIVDGNGTEVVRYAYDAWGKIFEISGSLATTLGTLNPLRYRGYVYDQETGLYYLQSRYYNPEWGRFLNADVFVSTGQGLLGNNMFAYCMNNPSNYHDPSGNACIMSCHGRVDLFMSNLSDFAGGGGGMSCWVSAAPQYIGETKGEGFLKDTIHNIPGGQAHGRMGYYQYEIFALDTSGVVVADASVALTDATLCYEHSSLTLLRLFSADLFMGMTLEDGLAIEAMASILSTSGEIQLGALSLSATAYVGGIGFNAGILVDGFTIGFAKGVGFEVTIRWTLE